MMNTWGSTRAWAQRLAIIGFSSLLTLAGCASVPAPKDPPEVDQRVLPRLSLLPPFEEPVVVAVYEFLDRTGQRSSGDSQLGTSFSTAIGQGSDTYLLRALKRACRGQCFVPVERIGLDHLLKERQLIRSTQQEFGQDPNLPALLFAGVIIEGAVIAYESNLRSGGAGARYLGVGVSTEYRTDRVSVALRLISTKTGEVLITTETSATIFSYQVSSNLFRFIEQNENLLEAETGMASNESPNIAVRRAVELAVIDIVEEGFDRSLWAARAQMSGLKGAQADD